MNQPNHWTNWIGEKCKVSAIVWIISFLFWQRDHRLIKQITWNLQTNICDDKNVKEFRKYLEQMKNMKKNINYKECNGVNVLQQCIDVFEFILKRGNNWVMRLENLMKKYWKMEMKHIMKLKMI